MQTVSDTPHTVPVMNINSEQTTAVMATAVAVERLVSVVEEVVEDIRIRCINVYTWQNGLTPTHIVCIAGEMLQKTRQAHCLV